MRVLITGSHGWTAKAVVVALNDAGHEVIGLDLPDTKSHVDSSLFGEIHYGTVSDYDFVFDVTKNCDLIVHLAVALNGGYESPEIPFDTNVKGTANIFASAVKNYIKRVILMSSAPFHVKFSGKLDAINDCVQGIGDDFMYDLTKCVQEDIARYYTKAHEIKAITLRAGHIVDSRTGLDPKGRSLDRVHYGKEAWVCRYDLARAVLQAIDYETNDYDAFHIIGAKQAKGRFDMERTKDVLGFVADSQFEEYI